MVERCKSHNRIQQWIRLESELKERGMEKVPRVVFEKVMVMSEVILMVIKKELEISCQVREVQLARAAFF